MIPLLVIVVVQSCSHIWFFSIPWTAACHASLPLFIFKSLPKFMSIVSVMPSSISSSDAIFSFCPQSFPASGTFPMSQLFTLGDQNTGASTSVLPVNIQGLSPLRLVWSPCCPRDSQESSPAPQFKGISSSALGILYSPALRTVQTFDGRVMSLLFNTLSRFVTAFLPRSNHLPISWLQSPPAVMIE